MQSPARFALSIFLLSSAVASSYHSNTKLRRDGVLNLYPFPRVGRANRHTWQIPINDMFLDEEPIKRQLYAFPRVGRSEMQNHREFKLSPQLEELLLGRRYPFVKRQSVVDQLEGQDETAMWFGPRLGRGFRSDEDDISQNEKSEPEQLEATQTDREKRQTKHT